MNCIVLNGRVTKDAELKYTKNGKPILVFTLAVNRSFKKTEEYQNTDFFYCKYVKSSGEKLAQYITKGKALLINGAMRLDTTNKDNQISTFPYVLCDEIFFNGSAQKKEDISINSNSSAMGNIVDMDDDMPF